MRSMLRTLLLVTIIAAIATNAMAQGKKKGAKKAKRSEQRVQAIQAVEKELAKLELTTEQSEKVKTLLADYAAKFAAAQKKISEIITPEQRQTMLQARKQATAEGKKGKELQAAVDAALNLPEEKKAALNKAQGESRALNAELRKAVLALLTPEQREKVELRAGGQGKPGGRKGKKAKGGGAES